MHPPSLSCYVLQLRQDDCDKKRPECSQCIRVGKKCPGYRDQLSLMFRDESSKVIQKAHAQWGSSGSPTEPSGSFASTSASAWKDESSSSSSGSPPESSSVSPPDLAPAKIPKKVDLNMDQQGLQFYINRYLMNHPDSPRTSEQVAEYFSRADVAQNVMIAVGLAGLSNLLGNKNMNLVARSKYVASLKQTGQLIASNDPAGLVARLRSVVTLALFEVVQGKGSRVAVGLASTHVNGAVAVLRSAVPLPQVPHGGVNGFIPYQATSTPLPPGFFETLKFCKQLMQGVPEGCSIDLAVAMARLLQVLASLEHTVYVDGRPAVDDLIQQFIQLDDTLEYLERRLGEVFPFTENRGEYPPAAVFRGKWHKYNTIWAARIWNHYRWARILTNQQLVKFISAYPISSSRILPAPQRVKCYATIERLAEDMLISVTSHWHHPMLDPEVTREFEADGYGNSGAVGVPSLLWHLKIAGCAPNVPLEFWEWAYNVMQVVWGQTGMLHAKSLSEIMEEHRSKLDKDATEPKVKFEEEDGQKRIY
ncbi:hypothetical protein Daesc_005286 [Daldinia eschscholtzii]|uniref:Zn(2)-C6 fungal-type domain-containing protein n=1 Tax=Daldinia eschscholtzii TaxID=292717 RepID=A0AAX6MK39_9PEZI